MSWCYC